MSEQDRVLVIGGGVIGATCAYYLAEAGRPVTLIDRGGLGQECSAGNCGLVCPSHVLPLAEPGAVGQALRTLLRRNGPLAIKLRWDPALWSWLWRFARQCNHQQMLATGRALQPLLEASMELYQELVTRLPMSFEWARRGLLYVYRTPAAWEAYGQVDRLLDQQFRLPARRLTADELLAFEPALKDTAAGGWYYEEDAQLRPDRLMQALAAALRQRGVEIREQCGLKALRVEGTRAVAAETDQGELPAGNFVLATGAWTPQFARQLGCSLPIQPGKGYSITMARPRRCPAVPIIFSEDRVAVTPLDSAYRLGSTMEFAGYDTSLRPARLELLSRAARYYLHEPVGEPVENRWYGWRPMTYDGRPIIDFAPALKNVLIAAGHNMIGVTLAPATGKLVAQLLAGQPTLVPVEPFRATRFA